jgi:uncharacterized protein (TIGR02646 family)
MKFIEKGTEPAEWKAYRSTPGVAFSAIAELQESLLKEQGNLCCYCMTRIDEGKMKVEHWKPRKAYPELILEYSNLMAACTGDFCSEQHCDTLKGHTEIAINPVDKKNNVEAIIKYSWSTGAIEVAEPYRMDVYETLNLNHPILRENRKKTLDALFKVLSTNKKYTESEYNKQLKKFTDRDKQGMFHPYCMIIVRFLEKKLRQFK